jgi:hypothetical protein
MFAQLAQAIAIILACFAAISGISAWKREFIGKRRIEIAEGMLEKFYKVRDAVAIIRSPFGHSGEGKGREANEHETVEHKQLLDQAYVVYERYEKQKDVFLEFNIMKYKFMASFGSEHEEIFTRTNKIINSIFISARMLGQHYWPRQGRVPMTGEEFKKHLDEMHKHERVFWDHLDDGDEIRKELANILTMIEKITKPCFEEQSDLYSIIMRKLF